MKKVDQTITHKSKGNCLQASTASIFELDIDQVPNFIKFPDSTWFDVFYYFCWAMKFEYLECVSKKAIRVSALNYESSINGFILASVPSKSFEDATHSVVIDLKGVVVHDPNPNKLWQDVNVLESGELLDWYKFRAIK